MEFMGEAALPPFQHQIPWKKQVDRPARRKVDYTKKTPCVPSKMFAAPAKKI